MNDNLLKIENPEEKGYIVREENGIKYIEKKEIINHEKHGECISFFQQQVQIDENNNTIIKQRNDYYENNSEAKKIESNTVTFENEEFKYKVIENYTNGQLTQQVTNDKKTETIINYYEDEKKELVKEINILDLSNNYYIYRSEIDKKGKVTYELNREKIINNKEGEYPSETIYTINLNGRTSKLIILENDKFKINNFFDLNNNLHEKRIEDKETGILEIENYTDGKLNKKITNNKKTKTITKFYEDEKKQLLKEIEILDLSNDLYIYRGEIDKKGNTTFKLIRQEVIEHKDGEYPIEAIYTKEKNGDIFKLIFLENDKLTIKKEFNLEGILDNESIANKKTGIITIKLYDKSGKICVIREENESAEIEKTINYVYDKLGKICVIREENESAGIEKTINYVYDKSGHIDYLRIETIDNKTNKTEKKYSKTEGNITKEYRAPMFSDRNILRTIEDLGNNEKKIEEGNIITWYLKDKKITVTYREDSYLAKKVIEADKETIVINYDMKGEFENISRNSNNLSPEIEEYFEKGQLFPILKIDHMEMPLVSLDKYKDICEKYNIEPLKEVLSAHNSIAQIKSHLGNFISFFKR